MPTRPVPWAPELITQGTLDLDRMERIRLVLLGVTYAASYC